MRCENCGLPIVRSDLVCPFCGNRRVDLRVIRSGNRVKLEFYNVKNPRDTVNVGPIIVDINDKRNMVEYPYSDITFDKENDKISVRILLRGGIVYEDEIILKGINIISIGKRATFQRYGNIIKLLIGVEYKGFTSSSIETISDTVLFAMLNETDPSSSLSLKIQKAYISVERGVIEIYITSDAVRRLDPKMHKFFKLSFKHNGKIYETIFKIPKEFFDNLKLADDIYDAFWQYFDAKIRPQTPYFMPLIQNKPVVCIYEVPPTLKGKIVILERPLDADQEEYEPELLEKNKYLVIYTRYLASKLQNVEIQKKSSNKGIIETINVHDDLKNSNFGENIEVSLNIDFGSTHVRVYPVGGPRKGVIFQPSWAVRCGGEVSDYISYAFKRKPNLLKFLDFPVEEGLYGLKILLLNSFPGNINIIDKKYKKKYLLNIYDLIKEHLKRALDNMLWIAGMPRVVQLNVSYPSYLSYNDIERNYKPIFMEIAKTFGVEKGNVIFKDEAHAVLGYFIKNYGEYHDKYKDKGTIKVAVIDVGGGTTDVILATLKFNNEEDDWVIRESDAFGLPYYGGVWLTALLLHIGYEFSESLDITIIKSDILKNIIRNIINILNSKNNIWEYLQNLYHMGGKDFENFVKYIKANSDPETFKKFSKDLISIKSASDIWNAFAMMERVKLAILKDAIGYDRSPIHRICGLFYEIIAEELRSKVVERWENVDILVLAGRASQTDYFRDAIHRILKIPREKMVSMQNPGEAVVKGLSYDVLVEKDKSYFYYLLDENYAVVSKIEEGNLYRIKYNPLMIYKSHLNIHKGRQVNNPTVTIFKRPQYKYFKIQENKIYILDRNKNVIKEEDIRP